MPHPAVLTSFPSSPSFLPLILSAAMRMRLLSLLGAGAGAHTPFDAAHAYVTSPLVRPGVLAGVRGVLALYALVAICVALGVDVGDGSGKSFLSFFTNLSYTGVVAYYVAAAVQTAAYARWGTYPLRRWPRALQAAHVVLQSTVVVFPIIVTVVFWALLSSPDTFKTTYSTWSNISIHGLNSLWALLEILFTNAPPAPWLALPLQIALLGGYLGVAYVTHATQGFYTYSFLDPAAQGALLAAYIVGIAGGDVVVFLAGRGVVVLRQRWAVRTGRAPKPDVPEQEALEEWEEVQRQDAEGGEREKRRGDVNDSGVAVGRAEEEAV
ncbi:hypothetical protein MIND_01239400 [Mycena indigotica]|uniref:Uncharacterized protein n=1 Tax=Mycena indigotica TaxID=2126181 RepID=A0A8H6VSE9_9AGAR|nr:uncharacterized protein MIND_01239400 [Mycena indigotica]KAF7292124.1 hypothetical protein MIND_01239400 [Mycena indigotica]